LNQENMMEIVDLMLAKVGKQLETQELLFEVTAKAKEKLVAEGFDKIYGARPLRRVIQRLIEDPLSEELLRLKHAPGDAVVIDVDAEGEITMNLKPKAKKEKKEKAEATAGAPAE